MVYLADVGHHWEAHRKSWLDTDFSVQPFAWAALVSSVSFDESRDHVLKTATMKANHV